jgi:MFS family permease
MAKPIFYGWWLVAVSALAMVVGQGTILYSYSTLAVAIGSELGGSRLTLSLGMTLVPIMNLALAPLIGRGLDTGSIRNWLIGGTVLLAAGSFALSLITAAWQLAAVYAVFMAGSTLILGPLATGALLSRWFSRRRGLALGIATLGIALGGFAYPPVVRWAIDLYGWRETCRALSLFTLVVMLPPLWLLVMNRPSDRGQQPDGLPQPTAAAGAAPAAATRMDTATLLRNRNFWIVMVITGVTFGVSTGFISNELAIFLESGLSRPQAALMISAWAVSGLVGKLAFGAVADRGDQRFIFAANLLLGIAGVSLLLWALGAGQLWPVLTGTLLLGVSGGGLLPFWGALLARLFGADNYGRSMGLMTSLMVPFTAGGPALFGLLHDLNGSYHSALAAAAAGLLLALALVPWLRMPPRA